MLKTIVIIVLAMLVVGLWIQPAITKGVVKATGKATFKLVKDFVQDIKQDAINETEVKNATGESPNK